MASVLNRYVYDLENLRYQTPTGQRSKFAKTAKNNLNVNDRRSYVMLFEQLRKKGLKNSGLNGTRIPNSAMPMQCSTS